MSVSQLLVDQLSLVFVMKMQFTNCRLQIYDERDVPLVFELQNRT